jgi:hypothetical protein
LEAATIYSFLVIAEDNMGTRIVNDSILEITVSSDPMEIAPDV